MESRIIQKVAQQFTEFKSRIIQELRKDIPISDIITLINQHELNLERSDFVKRKRTKNTIPLGERCIAKSAKNDQCTRRRKTGSTCCGTHSTGVPHGFISVDNTKTYRKEVWAEDINGIIYYLDADNNIYKTEDVMKNSENPKIIAKWSKVDSIYTIHW